MIGQDNWSEFIQRFFHVDEQWLKHIVRNWNWDLNAPTCGCAFLEHTKVFHYCNSYLASLPDMSRHEEWDLPDKVKSLDDHSEIY